MYKKIIYILVLFVLIFGIESCKLLKKNSSNAQNQQIKWEYNDTVAYSDNNTQNNQILENDTLSARNKQHHKKNDKTHKTLDLYDSYSQSLGFELEGNEHLLLVSELIAWVGTPYKYGGKTQSGTDCSGFVNAIYKKVFNIQLERVSADIFTQNTTKIKKDNLQCGDLVFFKIRKKRISHVGIYIAKDYFIHASSRNGVVINNLSEDYYKTYYYASGRVDLNNKKQ